MAGSQEQRLRHLIAGAQLGGRIDAELDQWKNAKERLREVGEALIAVSTPVSENLPRETVTSALESFKAVGQKVNDRAGDIDQIYTALSHAVQVTRDAQSAVAQMDGDQRTKPEFPPSKPGDDETDQMHDLKVYSGQMNTYNNWLTAREDTSQQHADKVETAWRDAITVMEKVPDDQTGGGGPGGGGPSTSSPIMPTGPVAPVTPTSPVTTSAPPHHVAPVDPHVPHVPPPPTPVPPTPSPPVDQPPAPTHVPAPHVPPQEGYPTTPHVPSYHPLPSGGTPGYPAGGDPYPAGVAPTGGVGPGSISGLAVGGSVGAGVLGGLTSALRGVGVPGLSGASSGVRSGGILGASARTAGSARGSLGSRAGAAEGEVGGRGTGGTGSRGAAGRRGSGTAGGAGGRGKDKDKRRKKSLTVELFDEDRDWIDDEGASSGVIG